MGDALETEAAGLEGWPLFVFVGLVDKTSLQLLLSVDSLELPLGFAILFLAAASSSAFERPLYCKCRKES